MCRSPLGLAAATKREQLPLAPATRWQRRGVVALRKDLACCYVFPRRCGDGTWTTRRDDLPSLVCPPGLTGSSWRWHRSVDIIATASSWGGMTATPPPPSPARHFGARPPLKLVPCSIPLLAQRNVVSRWAVVSNVCSSAAATVDDGARSPQRGDAVDK